MSPDATTDDGAAVLRGVSAGLPGHEDRPQQLRMAESVAEAIRNESHLVVLAGTGTRTVVEFAAVASSSSPGGDCTSLAQPSLPGARSLQ